jgi:hypothetical protein
MEPERPQSAHFQANEKPHSSGGLKALSRRIGGQILGALKNLETPVRNERVLMDQITEINLARRLAGTDVEDGTPRKDPFTMKHALGELGYPGNPNNNPYEYAAAIYGYGALEDDGAISIAPDPAGKETPQLIVIDLEKLNQIANKPPEEDVKLTKVLSLAKDDERDAIVGRIIRDYESAQ